MEFLTKIKIISWNVRRLNDKEKRLAIRQTVLLEKPEVICFQETKIGQMNQNMVQQTCGKRLKDFQCLDAQGTKGGILLAWNPSKFSLIQCDKGEYTISVLLKYKGEEIKVTSVYGPNSRRLRENFFEELRRAKPQGDKPWVVCGDFNVTLLQEDRNSHSGSN